MLTQADVKKRPVKAAERSIKLPESEPSTAAIPNSTAARDSSASETLEAAMRARISGFLDNQNPAAESEADRVAASVKGASTPDEVKSAVGERLGADFSDVRFHTGGSDAAETESIGALAYTTGRDVYFGRGGFDPSTAAHELTHTVQQGAVEGSAAVAAPEGVVQMKRGDKKGKKEDDLTARMAKISAGAAKGMGMPAPVKLAPPAKAPAKAPVKRLFKLRQRLPRRIPSIRER